MPFCVKLAALVADLALACHRMAAIMQHAADGDDLRRERDGVHEIHAEADRDDALVLREAGRTAGRVCQCHEHAAMHDAVEVRMLRLDRELEAHAAARRRDDFRLDVFREGILMIEIDDVLLKSREFCHGGAPFCVFFHYIISRRPWGISWEKSVNSLQRCGSAEKFTLESACASNAARTAGDKMAVTGLKTADGELVATRVINVTSLLGHWTSIDRNFMIEEGGTVHSEVKAETNPWTSWKILNGQLLLNRDTFDITSLSADSLYLENQKGIYIYKRQK